MTARPTPKPRPNPALSNPGPDMGIGRVGVVLATVALIIWAAVAVLMIASVTCGLGVVCR